jgi:hypothetical protein
MIDPTKDITRITALNEESEKPCWHQLDGGSRARRNVTFNPKATMRLHLHIHDMSWREIRASYIQPDEYNRITNECIDLVQKLDVTDNVNATVVECESSSGAVCYRGLESSSRRKSKLILRRRGTYAVMTKQEEQNTFMTTINDGFECSADGIAVAYRLSGQTKDSLLRAQIVAYNDHLDVVGREDCTNDDIAKTSSDSHYKS